MVAELLFASACDLAALVRAGEIAATELVETSLRRIDELDPELGAFTHVAHEAALASAAQVRAGDRRPFAGVPIAIKDNRAVAGMPLTNCSDLFGNYVPDYDAFVVRRLRDAGFVIVGKTAMPEMGILPTTESRRFGPTRNPWAPDRTPGGSSGGSAVAVAAGMVPIAHGNDGGGSTRIPAACCGLVGLKAARGRVSVGPDGGHSFLVVDGILTRTVADTAAVLDLIAGYEPGDATWAPPPETAYSVAAAHDPGRLRIGLALSMPVAGGALDPVCERAARDAAALLESLGHRVEEAAPPWDEADLPADFLCVFGPAVSTTTVAGGRLAGREPMQDDVEPLTWELWQHARRQDALTYLTAQGRVEAFARAIVSALARYDAVLTPALARPPVAIGEIHGLGPDPWSHYHRSECFTPYTAVANVTGLPAIALPLYRGEDGLPNGVQLIAGAAREDVLLALASQVQAALPWSGRRPAL